MKQEWFETFFQGPAVEFWILAMTPELTKADVDFLEKALALKPGDRILDVPCGNGRHSVELMRRGYRITGIDLSHEFLTLARQHGGDWRAGDMRSLDLQEKEFDAAFCFGNSFGYLDYESAHVFLTALARAIKPGGRFVIQTGTAAEAILPSLLQKRWHRFGDVLTLSECKYDALASRMDIEYTFIKNGRQETRPTCSYVFTVAEIARMLERAGFEVITANGGMAGEPFHLGSPQLLITAAVR